SILSFEGDGKVILYAGNYDAYRLQRERREEEQEKERPVEAKPARVVAEKRSKGLTYAERNELEGLLDRIAQAEQEVATLERELSDPSLYASRGKEVPVLHGRLAEAKQQADTLTARWEELEVKREEAARKA
ncbi:MAG: ABC transporter ATP-binding protein, partial [Deltaproteobacteria bacterium HGW-Deltaproteobacteria-20]